MDPKPSNFNHALFNQKKLEKISVFITQLLLSPGWETTQRLFTYYMRSRLRVTDFYYWVGGIKSIHEPPCPYTALNDHIAHHLILSFAASCRIIGK
jgi:hypothetical protein